VAQKRGAGMDFLFGRYERRVCRRKLTRKQASRVAWRANGSVCAATAQQ
jgi:hypothetical protein